MGLAPAQGEGGVNVSGDYTWTGAHTFNGTVTFAGTVSSSATISAALGTITTDKQMFSGTSTWNAAGVTFTGTKLNVTDTASASGSLLLDLQVGGTSRFTVRKDGYINGAAFANMFGGATVVTAGYLFAGGIFGVGDASTTEFLIEVGVQNVAVLNSAMQLTWSSVAYQGGNASTLRAGKDTGLARSAAGVLKVTDGSTGFGSLQLGTTSAALYVGTYAAIAAETVQGYITIKDSGGTDRKIAVVA